MITILLASYNGGEYIGEQLDSLLGQTIPADRIIISDDGSTDGTCGIIAEYAAKYPGRIILRGNENGRGAWRNFLGMMCKERDAYIMLSDQDDVWLAEKTEKTLQAMQKAEQIYGTDMPIVVHTDLIVGDKTLKVISPSLRQRMNADYSRIKLKDQIVQNTLTGCSTMYNRAMAEMLKDIPAYCVMHDWWLMLIASCFGKIITVEEPTILYRQHGGNEIGAKDMQSVSYLVRRAFSGKAVRQALNETYVQAENLLAMYGEQMEPEQRQFLLEYTRIPQYGKIKRLKELYRLDVWKNGLVRKAGQILYG